MMRIGMTIRGKKKQGKKHRCKHLALRAENFPHRPLLDAAFKIARKLL